MKEHLADGFTQAELARSLERVEARIARRRRARRVAWIAGPSLAIVLGVVAFAWARASTPPPLATAEGAPIPARIEPGRARFDDGSALVLEEGSELSLLRDEGGEVAFALRRGRVTFDIRPGGPRRWSLHAGSVVVRVLGTSFTVERRGEAVLVAVHRGVVEVDASGASRRLYAGERFAIGTDLGAVALAREAGSAVTRGAVDPSNRHSHEAIDGDRAFDPGTRDRAPRAGTEPITQGAREIDPSGMREPDARGHAPHARLAAEEPVIALGAREETDRGESSDGTPAALVTAPDPVQPGSEAAREDDGPAALLARSDRARRAGDLDEAVAALAQLVERYPDAPEAASAAASLGRIEQSRGRSDAAARVYARALELDPPPALAELAYERLVRLAIARDARREAERWARMHHETFPRGQRTSSIDGMLAPR